MLSADSLNRGLVHGSLPAGTELQPCLRIREGDTDRLTSNKTFPVLGLQRVHQVERITATSVECFSKQCTAYTAQMKINKYLSCKYYYLWIKSDHEAGTHVEMPFLLSNMPCRRAQTAFFRITGNWKKLEVIFSLVWALPHKYNFTSARITKDSSTCIPDLLTSPCLIHITP